MMKVKCITVNDLNNLLGAECITEVDVCSMQNQYNPVRLKVGIGGTLNIYYEVEDDETKK